jgi:L-seryl-tRNA(Ser) seleniumtransferase
MSCEGLSRRELLRRSGLLGGAALAFPEILAGEAAAAAKPPAPTPAATPAAVGLRVGPDIYQSIGVRPLINARGTYTILSGSTMLPEVRAAMAAASQHYVHLDELAEAIGARLATLTGAEWGLVTNGCAAGLTHSTAACVAGGNPDLHVRIPNLAGFAKDEVVIPKHSRNVYDRVRARGGRAGHRGLDAGRAGGGAGTADGAHLHPGRAQRGRERAAPEDDRLHRAAARRAHPGGRGGGDP